MMNQVIIDGVSRGILSYLVAAKALGFLTSLILLFALIRKPKIVDANSLLTVNVILAGAVFAVSTIAVDATNVNATENQISPTLCQVAGVFTLGSGTTMLVTVAFSGLYRYLIIVLEHRPLSRKNMAFVLAGIWIIFFALWLIPALVPEDLVDRFEVSHFGGSCTPNFTSRKPMGWVVSISTIAGIIGTPINVTLAYRAIWRKVIEANQNVSSALVVTTNTDRDEIRSRQRMKSVKLNAEKCIVKHAIVIFTLYAFFWTPVAIVWTYECITGKAALHYLVGIAHIFTATHSYASPFAVMYIDRHIRNAVLEFLGLSAYKSKSRPVSMLSLNMTNQSTSDKLTELAEKGHKIEFSTEQHSGTHILSTSDVAD